MMRIKEAKEALADLEARLEREGPTEALEAEWIGLRNRLVRASLWPKRDFASSWYFVGYLLFDRRGDAGMALHYRLEAFRASAEHTPSTAQDAFAILVCASLTPGGTTTFLEVLDRLDADWERLDKPLRLRIVKVLEEHLEEAQGSPLETPVREHPLTRRCLPSQVVDGPTGG